MPHNTSKEGFSIPKNRRNPNEFLSKSPYENPIKDIYKYIISYKLLSIERKGAAKMVAINKRLCFNIFVYYISFWNFELTNTTLWIKII